MNDIDIFILFILWLAGMYVVTGFGFWVGEYFQRKESESRKAQWARAKKEQNKLDNPQ